MAEPADINVDELRRRARRRLVGAIVLALGAAVVVPMLLESDPKPLGESVAVKIPPVDDGKFVNRLNETPPKAEIAPKTDAAPKEPRKSVSDAEKAVVSPPAKAPKYDTQLADKAAAPSAATPSKDASASPSNAPTVAPASTPPADAPKAEAPKAEAPKSEAPKAETKSDAKAEPKAPASVAKAEPKADAKAPVETPAAAAPKDGYSVQLAAFSDDKGANALASRLKRDGYPAYTEPLKTSRGTLYRVRVGPYASRDAANGVRDKLKTEGQNGIVAPSR